jgi:hypothetical protein
MSGESRKGLCCYVLWKGIGLIFKNLHHTINLYEADLLQSTLLDVGWWGAAVVYWRLDIETLLRQCW